jgi:thiamine pyrophosphate-dependent acetolactate synthase large subunit-like protein
MVKPSLDPGAAERIATALANCNPVLCRGGVLSGSRVVELTAFAELLELPVLHLSWARVHERDHPCCWA